MVQNSLTEKKETFGQYIAKAATKQMIVSTLGEMKAQRFMSAITSATVNNPALMECEFSTIVTAAMLGEALNLSPSPQLGHYYLVPFNDNKNGRKVAQFQLGYKGYIQLAIRTGLYRKLNAVAIKEGELKKADPINEVYEFTPIEDEAKRASAKTIGYYAMFEYMNGFFKPLYWSREKMELHATQYSKAFAAKRGYSFWEKDFDAMGLKTMLRQLISKWGQMSIEMQKAFEADSVDVEADIVPSVDDAQAQFFQPADQPQQIDAAPEKAQDDFFGKKPSEVKENPDGSIAVVQQKLVK